jgi:glycosyltransferase involved in cell wall biosynthesis
VRILRIADVPNNRTGGMSRVMYSTGDALRRAGHTVDYLFAEDFATPLSPRLRRFAVPAQLTAAVARRLNRGRRYDVVEIHEPLAAVYCLARRFVRRLPPVVIISYGVEARGRQVALAYKQRKGLPVTLRQRLSPLSVVWQANLGLRLCGAVICKNFEDVTFLRHLGVPRHRIVQAHSGVSADFLAAGATLDAARPRSGLLFLGTWIERKGTLDLTAAAAALLPRHPGLCLTIAGCGCPADVVLRDFPAGLHDQLHVIPKLESDAELLELYQRHAIFVLPSVFEGQPLSLLEAAALGLAPVTTNVCGMRDFIRHGQNGLLVPPGCPTELTTALDRLIRDPAETARLGEAARLTAQHFTWENAAALMLRAYQIAAAGAHAGPRVTPEPDVILRTTGAARG